MQTERSSSKKKAPSRSLGRSLEKSSSKSGRGIDPHAVAPSTGGRSPHRKGKYKAGTKILKKFEGIGTFQGVVKSFDGWHYRVHYMDGDKGDLSENEFERSDIEVLSDDDEESFESATTVQLSRRNPSNIKAVPSEAEHGRKPRSKQGTRKSPVFKKKDRKPSPSRGQQHSRGSKPLKKRRYQETDDFWEGATKQAKKRNTREPEASSLHSETSSAREGTKSQDKGPSPPKKKKRLKKMKKKEEAQDESLCSQTHNGEGEGANPLQTKKNKTQEVEEKKSTGGSEDTKSIKRKDASEELPNMKRPSKTNNGERGDMKPTKAKKKSQTSREENHLPSEPSNRSEGTKEALKDKKKSAPEAGGMGTCRSEGDQANDTMSSDGISSEADRAAGIAISMAPSKLKNGTLKQQGVKRATAGSPKKSQNREGEVAKTIEVKKEPESQSNKSGISDSGVTSEAKDRKPTEVKTKKEKKGSRLLRELADYNSQARENTTEEEEAEDTKIPRGNSTRKRTLKVESAPSETHPEVQSREEEASNKDHGESSSPAQVKKRKKEKKVNWLLQELEDYNFQPKKTRGGGAQGEGVKSIEGKTTKKSDPHESGAKTMLSNVTTTDALPEDFAPGDYDIVVNMAGSRKYCSHAGNIWLRTVVTRHFQQYSSCSVKEERTIIISSVVDHMRKHGGRFVKQDANNSCKWVYAEEVQCRDKCGQIFRNHLAKINQSSSTPKDKDVRVRSSSDLSISLPTKEKKKEGQKGSRLLQELEDHLSLPTENKKKEGKKGSNFVQELEDHNSLPNLDKKKEGKKGSRLLQDLEDHLSPPTENEKKGGKKENEKKEGKKGSRLLQELEDHLSPPTENEEKRGKKGSRLLQELKDHLSLPTEDEKKEGKKGSNFVRELEDHNSLPNLDKKKEGKKGSRLLRDLEDHNSLPIKRDSGNKTRHTLTAALSAPLEQIKTTKSVVKSREQGSNRESQKGTKSHQHKPSPIPASDTIIKTTNTLPKDFAPGDRDVVIAMGNKFCLHAGNVWFQSVVAGRIQEYSSASKEERGIINGTVIDYVRKHGGRFVRQDFERGGIWICAEDRKCRAKCIQAFHTYLADTYPSAKARKACAKANRVCVGNSLDCINAPANASNAQTKDNKSARSMTPKRPATPGISVHPKYPIGTLFFKTFAGEERYGGVITGFNGRYYRVRYPRDGDQEDLSDSDFDGSDIELLPAKGDGGSDTDCTESETDYGRMRREDTEGLSEDDMSEDENEIYSRVITVSTQKPPKQGSKRLPPERQSAQTSSKNKSRFPTAASLENNFKIPRKSDKDPRHGMTSSGSSNEEGERKGGVRGTGQERAPSSVCSLL